MSLEQELGREKPLQDLGALVTRYIKLKMSEEGECEEKEEDEEEAPDGFDLCVGTKSSRNKRKRASNCVTHSPSDKSSESLSHVRLTGTIAQYLLSRVPLPTSRLDLQKRFVKPKGSKSSKVDLDSILNHINNKFKSCLGLGIFGLDKSANTAGTASHKSSSNPKYYVVQLNRSKAHLDLVYQFGSINFKSIGDLTTNKDPSLLVSYRLCNSFLTFLSFLFGFFEVTFSDESLVKEDENSLKVLRNHEEIEIPVGKSHTLLSAVLNVSTPITPPTVSDYLLELIHEFTGIVSNSGKLAPSRKKKRRKHQSPSPFSPSPFTTQFTTQYTLCRRQNAQRTQRAPRLKNIRIHQQIP